MYLVKNRNHNKQSINLCTKRKCQDTDNGSVSSTRSHCSREDFSMNHTKDIKTSYKQHNPLQQSHVSMNTVGSINNSFDGLSYLSTCTNAGRRLSAGSIGSPKIAPSIPSESKKHNVNVIFLKLNESHEKPDLLCREHPLPQSKGRKTRATQTFYRESSAQTLPYLPAVTEESFALEDADIFRLPTILPGEGPPGLYEVEVLERARKRWSFLKVFKKNLRRKQSASRKQAENFKYKHILKAFEWQYWIEREEYIQECQLLRLELLIRMFNDRESIMHVSSKKRIQTSCDRIEKIRQAALKKNAITFSRALRYLDNKRAKQSRVWHKDPVQNELGYPSSEFYAPKMRYGVNPNRRHFEISRKGFDMRMDNLEKHAMKMDPKKMKCRFAKLRQWSKPKEVLKEFEQNFCSEANLEKLYESLINLRNVSKRERLTPQCLKLRNRPQISTITIEEQEEEQVKDRLSYDNSDTYAELEAASQTSQSYDEDLTLEQMYEEARKEMYKEELKNQKLIEKLQNETYKKEFRCEEVENLIYSYEGNTIGWLMRFLSEEMARVKEQRKLHFFSMLTQRERWHREAVEAGLRQKENCMRNIYEKLYEECNTVNVEITEKYLQSIMDTDIADYAHRDAEDRVIAMARVIDKDIVDWLESFKEVQNPLNRNTLRCALRAIVMADKNQILYHLERDETVKYIINEVLLESVFRKLEPYDISTTIASNMVDHLIDNDLYLFSTECSSSDGDYVAGPNPEAKHEAKSILKKLIQYSVPGRRWRTSTECLVDANVNEILDEVFDKEAAKEFIYEDDIREPYITSNPSLTNIMVNDLDRRPFYSTESSKSTTDREVKINSLDGNELVCGLETTKELQCNEKLLVLDPDLVSVDTSEIKFDGYKAPRQRTDEQLSVIHKIPSTHELHRSLDFSKTPIYAPSSDEDEKMNNRRKSEEIVIGARERILSIVSEYEEEANEYTENSISTEQEEYDEGEYDEQLEESELLKKENETASIHETQPIIEEEKAPSIKEDNNSTNEPEIQPQEEVKENPLITVEPKIDDNEKNEMASETQPTVINEEPPSSI